MKKYISLLLPSLLFIIGLTVSFQAKALPAGFFAENSVLAEGKWIKVEIASAGMQFIPAATLRTMGFTNPADVNVYGTGGRMIPECLDATLLSDDLPLLPSIKNEKGIYFFATDVVGWESSYDTPYTHTLNPYDTKSYYFLSDRPVIKPLEMRHTPAPASTAGALTSFVDRLYHESELAGPAESGRTIYGEDFRGTRTQNFPFSLPGATGEDATIKITFAAKAINNSSIIVSADGIRLPATTSDQIKGTSSAGDFAKAISTIKEAPVAGNSMNVGIQYSATGTVNFARLNYIELFYPRQLNLAGGELLFHFSDPGENTAAISGCSNATKIWEVTDPTAPKEVEYVLNGSVATISIDPAGYQEFVAFDPAKIAQAKISYQSVANQNIHGISVPDMVIISYDTYMEGANRIATLHRDRDGMDVVVLRPEDIYNEFSGGSADISAFRKLLKMWYDRSDEKSIKYCLIMGRPYYDNRVITPEAKNIGYRPMPIWEEPTLLTDAGSYSTDSYIAMLDDCHRGFSMSSAKLRVAVGRIPVTSSQEALVAAEKIEKYVLNPDYGVWRNKMLFVADDIDDSSYLNSDPTRNTTFFDQTQTIHNIISTSKEGKKYLYDRIYLDGHKLELTAVGHRYPTAKAKFLSSLNDGVVYTNYLGHAGIASWTHEQIFTKEDIQSLNNRYLPILFGGTCDFGHWDGNTVSGAEMMMLNPNGGVIATIIPSRTVYITQNFNLNRAMAPYLLQKGDNGENPRIGEIYQKGMNTVIDTNRLRFCLMGDPALTFPMPVKMVDIESVNGVDINNSSEYPELPALGKVEVSGKILNAEGTLDEDFNGTLELMLFDAEKVVETKNFGKGLDRSYNERKTRLASTTIRVEKGRWSTRLLLPAEIDNNYSPAMITAYAWNSTTGDEAHGSTEQLYVYGYDEESEEDTKAPDIETFYLNSRSFKSGGVVNANPIVFASFFDESGINISDSGIGHQMMLTLDGKTVYNDLNNYYSADIDREGAGSICYPLNDVEPGKHTLTLTVWDNANNSASASVDFNVAAALDPVISDLSTNVNPASTSVIFNVTIDRPNTNVDCMIEVFDLGGRTVWTSSRSAATDMNSQLSITWDLRDASGVRVPRGIYLYRATVRTPEGTYSSKSCKLAVTAQ